VDNPGPRYRKTPWGWEPAGAFKTPAPLPPDPRVQAQEAALAFIAEVAGCGVPPGRAVRYWDWILAALQKHNQGRHHA
jgi:hypothetical protein